MQNKSVIKQNRQLVEELRKPIIRKLEKWKVYSFFKDKNSFFKDSNFKDNI